MLYWYAEEPLPLWPFIGLLVPGTRSSSVLGGLQDFVPPGVQVGDVSRDLRRDRTSLGLVIGAEAAEFVWVENV